MTWVSNLSRRELSIRRLVGSLFPPRYSLCILSLFEPVSIIVLDWGILGLSCVYCWLGKATVFWRMANGCIIDNQRHLSSSPTYPRPKKKLSSHHVLSAGPADGSFKLGAAFASVSPKSNNIADRRHIQPTSTSSRHILHLTVLSLFTFIFFLSHSLFKIGFSGPLPLPHLTLREPLT